MKRPTDRQLAQRELFKRKRQPEFESFADLINRIVERAEDRMKDRRRGLQERG